MARLNPRRRRKKREQLAKNEAILRGEFWWSPASFNCSAELNRIWNEMFDNVRIANAPEPETKSEA